MLLVLAAGLLLSALVFGRSVQVVLSLSLIFLIAGAFAARLDWVRVRPDSPVVDGVITVALAAILFVGGTRLPGQLARRRRGGWTVSAGLGLLVAVVGGTVAVHALAGVAWLAASIVAVALAPIGPLTAEPARTVAFVPDALCIPLLVVLIAIEADRPVLTGAIFPLVGGAALGVAVPAIVFLLTRLNPGVVRHPLLQPVVAVAVFAIAQLTGVNPLLAALAAGLTGGWLGAVRPDGPPDQIESIAGATTMLIFGALLTPVLVRGTPALVWLAAVLVVVLIRPVVTALALRNAIPGRSLAIAWRTPQPVTSALLGLMVLRSGLPDAAALYRIVAVTVVVGVLLHAATDWAVSRGRTTWTSSANPSWTK